MGDRRSNIYSTRITLLVISYHLVVYLDVADPDGDGLVEAVGDLVVDLSDGPRHNASVLVLGAAASHREGLARTRLSIAQDRPVVPLHD
jgi:hypothetical protein